MEKEKNQVSDQAARGKGRRRRPRNTRCELTPAGEGHFGHVVPDAHVGPPVHLQAEVEGLRGEPHEGGQHEVVHEHRHDLAAHRALQLGHKVVGQEGEVEQEHGQHQVHQDPRRVGGLGPPGRRETQRRHVMLGVPCFALPSC